MKPTAYKPLDRAGYGYDTIQVSEQTYQVTFAGNRATPQETVEAGMMVRAAEIARQRGYERFALMERTLQERQRTQPRYFGPYPYTPRYYHRVPIYHYRPAYYDRETTYRAVATLHLFRGEPPAKAAGIYDVDEVLGEYADDVRRPGSGQDE